MPAPRFDNLCDLPFLRVGHTTLSEKQTGCTVILFEKPLLGGVDVRGSAPGTKEIEVLKFVRFVRQIHGVCFTGGSAYGLEAQSGVMQFLREQGVGLPTGASVVPIVPAACIFDLHIGSSAAPDKQAGYEAAKCAKAGDFQQGLCGAGTGATVGKLKGVSCASPGGVGSASFVLDKLVVAALLVVNCYGDVVKNGKVVAGARKEATEYLNMRRFFLQGGRSPLPPFSNTILILVATNAQLDKEGVTKIAQAAQDALCEVIQPCHTQVDGDLAIAVSSAEIEEDLCLVLEGAKDAVRRSVWKAIQI